VKQLTVPLPIVYYTLHKRECFLLLYRFSRLCISTICIFRNRQVRTLLFPFLNVISCLRIFTCPVFDCIILCLSQSSVHFLKSKAFNFSCARFNACLMTSSLKLSSLSFPLLPTHSMCRGCLFSLDHTQTHTTVDMTPLDEGSACRRDLYLTTHSQETNIHAPGVIRTHDPSNRSAADLRLKPRGRWVKIIYLT
jgi:hypothetical protein